MRMATKAPRDLTGYMQCTEEGVTKEALHISTVTDLWLSAVHTFGALYEVVFQSVYSRTGTAK